LSFFKKIKLLTILLLVYVKAFPYTLTSGSLSKKSNLPNERECPTPSLPRRSFIAVVHQEMALCSGTIRNIVKPA
jgi:hypothetical protein